MMILREILTALILCSGLDGSIQERSKSDLNKAARQFEAGLASGNDAFVVQGLNGLVSDNTGRAVEIILKGLRTSNPSHYWIIISGLARITSDEGISSIATEILSGKDLAIRRDLVMVLRLSDASGVTAALLRVIKEGSAELQVSAIDEIVDREVINAVPMLIDLAERDPKEDRELTRRVFKALRALTKEEPNGGPTSWRRWWEGVAPKLLGQQPSPRKAGVGQTVVESLRRGRATDYETLKTGKKGEVVVVKGLYDQVQDVLSRLGISYTELSSDEFVRSDDLGIGKAGAVFVNCGVADLPARQAERVRKYVESGGYLFVTDQGINSVVRPSFPGYLNMSKGGLPDMVVEIVPWKGSTGHPLLRGVVLPPTSGKGDTGRLKWVIDSGAPVLAFDPKKVVPLVESPDLSRQRKPSAVAVTFAFGGDAKLIEEGIPLGGVYEELFRMKGGKVVCVLSHFMKQRTNEDGFALQNLLINFLIEARERSMMRSAEGMPKRNP